MTASTRNHTRLARLAVLVAGLAGAGWLVRPAHAGGWIIGFAAMGSIWGAVAIMERGRPFSAYSESEIGFLLTSVAAGGFAIALALAIKLADALGAHDTALLQRAFGVGMGGMLVLMGNAVPKVLAPMTEKRCAPSRTQALQRFTGWVFVLAGIGYAAAWIFLPRDRAGDAAIGIGVLAICLVALRVVWAVRGGARVSLSPRP